MSKRAKRFLIAAIISVVFSVIAILILIQAMYTAQYNSKGISHFLVITIDNSPRQYIGDLEGHKLYLEGLNKDETVFRSKDAKNVSIKAALEDELVSIADLRKHAFSRVKKDDSEILKYENYEIVIYDEIIIIRPLKK